MSLRVWPLCPEHPEPGAGADGGVLEKEGVHRSRSRRGKGPIALTSSVFM